MTEFDALLKRSFAEAPEPVDEGFATRVTSVIARREASLKNAATMRGAVWAVASGAIVYGAYALASAMGADQLITIAADQVGAARGAIGASAGEFSLDAGQVLGAGMTQILLAVAALTGGAVAYRSAQD